MSALKLKVLCTSLSGTLTENLLKTFRFPIRPFITRFTSALSDLDVYNLSGFSFIKHGACFLRTKYPLTQLFDVFIASAITSVEEFCPDRASIFAFSIALKHFADTMVL